MKKGRHRRFEEARALKRSTDINIEDIFESLQADRPEGGAVDGHPEWSDLAEEDDDEV